MGKSAHNPQSPTVGGQQRARCWARDGGPPSISDLDLDHATPDGPGHPDRSVRKGFGMVNRIGDKLRDHDLCLINDGRVNVEIS
jgi:hypothetical protein